MLGGLEDSMSSISSSVAKKSPLSDTILALSVDAKSTENAAITQLEPVYNSMRFVDLKRKILEL